MVAKQAFNLRLEDSSAEDELIIYIATNSSGGDATCQLRVRL